MTKEELQRDYTELTFDQCKRLEEIRCEINGVLTFYYKYDGLKYIFTPWAEYEKKFVKNIFGRDKMTKIDKIGGDYFYQEQLKVYFNWTEMLEMIWDNTENKQQKAKKELLR